MRPTLLKSFLVSLFFWFFVTLLWWSFQRPEVNLATLAALKGFLPFLPFEVPESASVFTSIGVQTLVLQYWTVPILLASAASGLVGYGIAWWHAHGTFNARKKREEGTGEYRGVSLTLGVLPFPLSFPKHELSLGDADDALLSRMSEGERLALEEILGTISAHPQAFAGEGVTTELLDHALAVSALALESNKNPGLVALVAAGYELGKITAFRKADSGAWVQAKRQDKEAAKVLATLGTWYALPAVEKNAVMLAVKYYTTPKLLPEPEGDITTYRLALEVLAAANGALQAVVAPAPAVAQQPTVVAPAPATPPVRKEQPLERPTPPAYVPPSTPFTSPPEAPQVLNSFASAPARTMPSEHVATQDLPSILFDALLQSLPLLSFQSRGLPKGVQAVAWKVGTRVYLLEIKLRETITAKIPLEVRGALTPNPRERSRLQPFTQELLKALHARGWLVTEINNAKVDPKEALWNVKAGKLEFKGVIVVDVPPEYLAQLPADDSMYEIVVTGALFSQAAGMAVSKQDLLGSVLRPNPDLQSTNV